MTDITGCLPEFITKALKKALRHLHNKIKGFANPNALLIALWIDSARAKKHLN